VGAQPDDRQDRGCILIEDHPVCPDAEAVRIGDPWTKERDVAEVQTTDIATAEANTATILGAYDAFGRGDVEAALAAFADDILWHVPGRGPISRDYHGPADVLTFIEHFMTLSAGTFRIRIDDVLAKGDRVVVLCTESAERGGRSWSSPQVHAWTLKDGRAAVFWQYQGDQQTEDEFWSAD
jgi:ketosteroid isomerase-like protein